MCVECGTALNVSTSPVADREREFIRRRIAEGKSKPEIKAALVDEYGREGARGARGRRLRRGGVARARACCACWRCSAWGSRRCAGAAGPTRSPAADGPTSSPRTGGAWTPTWRRSTGERRRRHHGAGRVRGRLRLVRLALRAAARARLPVRGLGRLAHGDQGPRAIDVADPAAGDRLLRRLHRGVRGARDDRHEPRVRPARQPRDARQGRRRGDHRARRVLPADAVRRPAQPRVAPGGADLARRLGRPAAGRRRLRGGMDAVRRARPSARSSRPHRSPTRSPRAGSCCSSTRSASPSRSC